MTQALGLLPCSAALTIGDVDLRIHSDLPLLDPDNPPYLPFMDPPAVRGTHPSVVDVEVLAAPCVPSNSPAFFDSGSAWKMQPEGSGYRLSFQIEGRPFHTIACSDADTTRVRVHVHQDLPSSGPRPDRLTNPVRYPLDQLLLMNHLSSRGGMIVHAAGAILDGQLLLFPGVSGAGKSTLSRLFTDAGLHDSLLSDDRVILRTPSGEEGGHGHIEAWGTPWPGEALVAKNALAPLAAVLFLVKADVNQVVPLTVGTAMRRLVPMLTCPWYDQKRLPGALETCTRVVESVPCYDLRFRPDGEVVPLLTGRSWLEVRPPSLSQPGTG